MMAVSLTMGEADAISELAEHDEPDEPILGLIGCKHPAPPAIN